MSILEELYNGQVYPFEDNVLRRKHTGQVNRKVCEILGIFFGEPFVGG